MALAKEDIEFIKEHLGEWLIEVSLGKPPAVYEIELRERMVRVEEELKHQRELMRQGFEQVERRFEQIDKRFEQVEKRFEQVDKRFEQVDRRFDELIKRSDRHFLWLIGFITTIAALIIAAGKLL
jgi:predicted transcriptional regulator